MRKPKKYGMFYFKDKNGEIQFRKPTPRQRKAILVYYLRRRSGRTMTVKRIANDFRVSERTMQKLLKELEAEKIIRREPVFDDNGFQKANRIVYIGEKKRLTGNEPSIDKIYEDGNPMDLRSFEWTGYWECHTDYNVFFENIKGYRFVEPDPYGDDGDD